MYLANSKGPAAAKGLEAIKAPVAKLVIELTPPKKPRLLTNSETSPKDVCCTWSANSKTSSNCLNASSPIISITEAVLFLFVIPKRSLNLST